MTFRMNRTKLLGLVAALAAISGAAIALPGDVILKIDNPQPGLLDQFGDEIAVTKKDLAIGAPGDNNVSPGGGSVSYYDAKDLTLRQLENSVGFETFTSFGAALAIGGKNLVIGMPQADFGLGVDNGVGFLAILKSLDYQKSFQNPVPAPLDYFGADVAARKKLFAISATGDDTVTTNAGVVLLFDANTSTPIRTLFPASTSQDQEFGKAMAFVGNTIGVGAPGQLAPAGANAGAVHLYDSRNSAFLGILLESPQVGGSRFGAALGGSKKVLAVGAPGDSTAGVVYLYDIKTNSLIMPIPNPSPATGDAFGASVAFVGNKYFVVGAPGDDFGGVNAGAAYVFDAKTGAPLLTIINPESSVGDRFGQVVASDGKRLFIGCPGNLVSGFASAGSVFVIEGP